MIGERPDYFFLWRHFDEMRCLLRQPVIFDGRNLYDPQALTGLGFTYYAIGRGKALPPG